MNSYLKHEPVILLIDDDLDVLTVFQLNLIHSGFKTLTALNTIEAEEMIARHSIDLIVCDLTMPTESGLAFHSRLSRTHDNLPPFIFCSGLPMKPIDPPYPQGIAGFLMKPFPISQFIDTICDVLEMTPESREIYSETRPNNNFLTLS